MTTAAIAAAAAATTTTTTMLTAAAASTASSLIYPPPPTADYDLLACRVSGRVRGRCLFQKFPTQLRGLEFRVGGFGV